MGVSGGLEQQATTGKEGGGGRKPGLAARPREPPPLWRFGLRIPARPPPLAALAARSVCRTISRRGNKALSSCKTALSSLSPSPPVLAALQLACCHPESPRRASVTSRTLAERRRVDFVRIVFLNLHRGRLATQLLLTYVRRSGPSAFGRAPIRLEPRGQGWHARRAEVKELERCPRRGPAPTSACACKLCFDAHKRRQCTAETSRNPHCLRARRRCNRPRDRPFARLVDPGPRTWRTLPRILFSSCARTRGAPGTVAC